MVIVFLLDIYGKVYIGTLVSIGNFGGVIWGQIYGDWIRANNILKVTEDMDPGIRQHHYHHPGVEIWLGCVIGVIIVGVIMIKILKMKSKGLNKTVTNIVPKKNQIRSASFAKEIFNYNIL